MKNKKYAKILVLALSLALLIGAAVGIAASAEGTPEVLKKNIEYGETLKFMVAVDPESVGGEGKTVTLSVYEGDPENGGKLVGQPAVAEYQDTSETNIGVANAYIATSTYGVSALAYGQEYYLVVECDGVATTEKYSAVEYFLKRLYGDGIINATDELGIAQKALYQNAIAYGSSAQTVAELEDTNLDTGTNVADFLWVAAENGTVNGAASAVVTKDTALNFAYTGDEDPSGLAYWLDPNGNKTTVATASGIYAPKFATYTFDDLSNDTVITPSTSSGWKTASFADGDKDVSKYKNLLINEIPTATDRSQSYSIVDGQLYYTTTGGTRWALNNTANAASGANHTVFETDLTISLPESKTSTTITAQFYATGVSNALYSMIFRYYSDDVSDTSTNEAGKFECYFQRNQTYTDTTTSSTIGKDTTHLFAQVAEAGSKTASINIKFESYYISSTDDSTMVMYVNDTPLWILDSRGVDRTNAPSTKSQVDAYQNTDGVYVCQYAFIEGSSTDYTPRNAVYKCVMFNPNTGYATDMYFDNIIFESDVVAEENIPTYNLTRK
ncbi:MAG: hypothetical protein IJX92_04450 [Clostridia bacterium]|nr:hypothetical protein [Clostridia bacterium]